MAGNITVQRARRILGKVGKGLTDDQVRDMLDTMYLLAGEDMLYNGSKESEKSNDSELPEPKK